MFTFVVTVTQVVDSAMKSWAELSSTGQTTLGFDLKVIAAHDRYRQVASVAKALLIAYRATRIR